MMYCTAGLVALVLLSLADCTGTKQGEEEMLRIEPRLEESRLLEGESVVLRLKYANPGDDTQHVVRPDPGVAAHFDLSITLSSSGGVVATLEASSLPMTEHGLHAEPEVMDLAPGSSSEVAIHLSPFLPSLPPGDYDLAVASTLGATVAPSVLELEVVPVPPITSASYVQEAPASGLVTAYLTSLEGRDVVVLERLEDFGAERFVAEEWPVRYRRRVLEADDQVSFERVYLSKLAEPGRPVRHLVVESTVGGQVVDLEDGYVGGRHRLGAFEGDIVSGGLLTAPDEVLHVLTRDAGERLRYYRITEGAVGEPLLLEGRGGGPNHLFAGLQQQLWLYVTPDGHGLFAKDLVDASDQGRRIYEFDGRVGKLAAVPVFDDDGVAMLIAALKTDLSGLDVLRWDFETAPSPVRAADYAVELASIRFVMDADDGLRVAYADRGELQWRMWPDVAADDAFATATSDGTALLTRTDGWWRLVPE